MQLLSHLPKATASWTYKRQQRGLFWLFAAMQIAYRDRGAGKPPAQAIRALRTRYFRLLEREAAALETGSLSPKLALSYPLLSRAAQLKELRREVLAAKNRKARGGYQELPDTAGGLNLPAYYKRNFHWQSHGYLDDASANIYDLSVDFLFLGMAEPMRRQILAPMREHLEARGPKANAPLRILDVGCGTGRSLLHVHRAYPDAELVGVDLSAPYLRAARRLFRNEAAAARARFVEGNGEVLPFENGSFDIVTSTYLLHELPRNARRNVLSEMTRVLSPRGLVVLEDSAQLNDGRDIAFFLERFPDDFHEPFYLDYIKHPLEEALAPLGFESIQTQEAYLSKVVSARCR